MRPGIVSLPPEVLRRVRRLQIVAGKRVAETLAGQFRSVFRGSGMEFDEVREYEAGDDVRAIDWNVTARSGRPFIKRYAEERERRLVLVVDLSGSQRFGTRERFKLELAAEIAAVLAACANRSNDKVGLLAFTDRIEHFVPARKGTRHAGRVIRDVLALSPESSGTDLSLALDTVARGVRRGAILVVISDLLDDKGLAFEKPLRRATRRHDLILVRPVDPREEELPPVGLVRFRDLETGRDITVDASHPGIQERYRQRARERRAILAETVKRAGADYVEVVNGSDYLEPLRRLFALRARRRGIRMRR